MSLELSYRALMRVPSFARVASATILARLSGQMWEIVLVLFVLQRYGSPALAGLAVLFSVVPGLIAGPIAGALLDRQGRIRLMILDYLTTGVLATTIALLSLTHRLPIWLLLAIVTVLSMTNILSVSGARSLFPLMVPRALWDRANGFDTSTYSVTSIAGPALAGLLVGRFSPEAALIGLGVIFTAAAATLIGVPEPVGLKVVDTPLLHDAWQAVVYVFKNVSLRGLAISMFVSNLGFGVVPIAIPVIVLRQLHGTAATVGEVFAVFGLAGLVVGLLIGRINTEGRERLMIGGAMALFVPILLALIVADSLWQVFLIAIVGGAAGSLVNVGIFSMRQRRTDPEWFGRAFAVSLSINYAGAPIGSGVLGAVLERSAGLALLLGAAFNLAGAVLAFELIPASIERKGGEETEPADAIRER